MTFYFSFCKPWDSSGSLEDIAPAQIYHANLNFVVFFLPSFVVIFSLNKKCIFFISVFSYPIFFLSSTFPLSASLLLLFVYSVFSLSPSVSFLCMLTLFAVFCFLSLLCSLIFPLLSVCFIIIFLSFFSVFSMFQILVCLFPFLLSFATSIFSGPILENKGMGVFIQKKGQGNIEKGQNILKFGQKLYRI